MKFRSIYLILIIIMINYVKCEHLTKEENLNRLKNCGKPGTPKVSNFCQYFFKISFLATPKVNKDNYEKGLEIEHSKEFWIVKVHTKNDDTKTYPTAGFFISPRHILTSAESVMDGNMKWAFDGAQLDMKTIDDSNNTAVPEGGIAAMEVVLGNCGKLCIVKPKTAVVLNIKNPRDFDSMFTIMIIELENDVPDVQFPCLADETVKVQKSDEIDSVKENNKWICIYSHKSEHDKGGPLIKTVNDKQMVIGLGSNSVPDTGKYKYFFDLRAYAGDICSLSGVCPVKKLTSTTTITTISTSLSTTELEIKTTTEQSIDSSSFSSTTISSAIQLLITIQERKRTREPMESSNKTTNNGEDDEFNIREYDEDSNEFYLSKKPIRKSGGLFFFGN